MVYLQASRTSCIIFVYLSESVMHMNNLFHPDSKVMRCGYKLADLMILQLSVILACLPVVTAGAAFSAAHYVLLKMYRNQEGSVWKEFWHSFGANFRQATTLWLIYLGVVLFLYVDLRLIIAADLPYLTLALYFLPFPLLLTVLSLSWVFILQSRYENTVGKTIRHSLVMVLSHPLYTLINILLLFAPLFLVCLSSAAIPFILFLGYSVPGLVRAVLYSRIFDKLEGTDWRRQQVEAE